MPENKFTFEISLSVLDHLGRNLYRSFATVLGEAVSNSWDADAENVWIYINKDKNSFFIKDDGNGMTAFDFQNKFLKIGYSKRKEGQSTSPNGRPYIGRKGIGKLAMLSCAEKVHVISKTADGDYIGGVIDNSGLDQAITDDLVPEQYQLDKPNLPVFNSYAEGHKKGTIIYFENIKEGIRNSLDYLKKIIALYFRFSLIDNAFNIFIDDQKVTLDDLRDLAEKTEFLWKINNLEDPYVDEKLTALKEPVKNISMLGDAKGFISSVNKPRDLKITGMNERVSVDLFVNGRLRERDILKYIPTARLAENYFYGQIHFDALDDNKDRFTTSREGIIAEDPKFKEFLKNLKTKISEILEDWDKWRIKHRQEGDAENNRISQKERSSAGLYNAVSGEYEPPDESENKRKVDGWVDELRDDAVFNFESYAECFVAENLLRKHIEENKLIPASCTNADPAGNTCADRYNPKNGNIGLCEYCKGERGKQSLQAQKNDANTSISIRNAEDNLLLYLDYIDLAKIVGDDILKEEDKPYKPLRNSIMHTSRLTREAKTKLTSVFDNIVSTVKGLIGAVAKKR